MLLAEGEGRKDAGTGRMSGRARDGRLVHLAVAATLAAAAAGRLRRAPSSPAAHRTTCSPTGRSRASAAHRRRRRLGGRPAAGDAAGDAPGAETVGLGLPRVGAHRRERRACRHRRRLLPASAAAGHRGGRRRAGRGASSGDRGGPVAGRAADRARRACWERPTPPAATARGRRQLRRIRRRPARCGSRETRVEESAHRPCRCRWRSGRGCWSKPAWTGTADRRAPATPAAALPDARELATRATADAPAGHGRRFRAAHREGAGLARRSGRRLRRGGERSARVR